MAAEGNVIEPSSELGSSVMHTTGPHLQPKLSDGFTLARRGARRWPNGISRGNRPKWKGSFRWCPPFRVLQIVSGLDERKLVLGRGPASSYNTRMKRTRLDLS